MLVKLMTDDLTATSYSWKGARDKKSFIQLECITGIFHGNANSMKRAYSDCPIFMILIFTLILGAVKCLTEEV